MNTKNTTLKALIDNVVTELMVKTTGEQIYLDGETLLADKIEEIIAALNERVKTTEMQAGLDALRTELQTYADAGITNLVDGAPEAFNTLREIADALGSGDDTVGTILERIGLLEGNYTDINNRFTTHKDGVNPHGITPAIIGLANVDNTADKDKSVKHATTADIADNAVNADRADVATLAETATVAENATHADSADEAIKAVQDGNGAIITETYLKRTDVGELVSGSMIYVQDFQPERLTSLDLWFDISEK